MKLLYISLCVALSSFGLQAMESCNFEFRSPIVEAEINRILFLENQEKMLRQHDEIMNAYIARMIRKHDHALQEQVSTVFDSIDFRSPMMEAEIEKILAEDIEHAKKLQEADRAAQRCATLLVAYENNAPVDSEGFSALEITPNPKRKRSLQKEKGTHFMTLRPRNKK